VNIVVCFFMIFGTKTTDDDDDDDDDDGQKRSALTRSLPVAGQRRRRPTLFVASCMLHVAYPRAAVY
jgi:hypothetical protein